MTVPNDTVVDRERDVLVASFDLTIKVAHGRKPRSARGGLSNVFLGVELIDHFENRDDAIALARRVSAKSRRPAWISVDGVTFDKLDRL